MSLSNFRTFPLPGWLFGSTQELAPSASPTPLSLLAKSKACIQTVRPKKALCLQIRKRICLILSHYNFSFAYILRKNKKMPVTPYPTHKIHPSCRDTWDTPQNLEKVPQFTNWWMPARLSPNKGSSRAKIRSSAAYLREPQGSGSGCGQHLPPAAGPGKMRSMDPRYENKGKLFHRKATEVQFAHRRLSPTPKFSPSLPIPVWETTAQFLSKSLSSSTHLTLQELELPHQTPTPGCKNPTVLS